MRNFKQEGVSLDCIAPSGGVVAGLFYLIGGIGVVAATTAAEGEPFAGWSEGVYTFTKETHATTQALAFGGPVYWDATNHRATKTAAGNILLGACVNLEGVVSTDDEVDVKLWSRGVASGAAIADIALAVVTGVDGTGSNAASKSDVDARFTTVKNKINEIVAALEGAGTIAA